MSRAQSRTQIVEQLIYTWAPRGLEGTNRFQILAASPGMRDRRASRTDLALRLCRYERPAGVTDTFELPISFGWVDTDNLRFVFHRSYAGQDASGRPGNFVAHVLSGPAGMLPHRDVLCRYRSDFWSSSLEEAIGEGLDGMLPRIGLDEISEGPMLGKPHDERLRQLVQVILSGNFQRKIALAEQPDDVVRLLAAITMEIPGILHGRAVSTYESGDASRWFHIVGVGHEGRGPAEVVTLGSGIHVPAPTRSAKVATGIVISDDSLQIRIKESAMEAAVSVTGGFDIPNFVSLVDALACLGGDGPVEIDRLMPALRFQAAAEVVLEAPDGRRAIADYLIRGRDDLVAQMRSTATEISPKVLLTAGEEVGRLLLSRLHSRADLVDTLQRLPSISGILMSGCLSVILEQASTDFSILDSCPPEALAILLRFAATPTNRSQAVRLVDEILQRSSSQYSIIVADLDIPEEWRARVVAEACAAGGSAPAFVADDATRNPGFAMKVLRLLAGRPAVLRKVLDLMTPVGACRIVQGLLAEIEKNARTDLVLDLARRLSIRDRVALLVFAARMCSQTHTHWEDMVLDTVRRLLAEELDRSTGPVEPGPPDVVHLLALTEGSEAGTWRGLIDLMRKQNPPEICLEWISRFDDERDQRTAARLFLGTWLMAAKELRDVYEPVAMTWEYLDFSHSDLAELILHMALRATSRRSLRPALVCLVYIVEYLVGAEYLPIRRRRFRSDGCILVDDELQAVAARIATLLGPVHWANGSAYVRNLGGRERCWWKTLGSTRGG